MLFRSVFPSKDTLRMSARSGKLFLPLSGTEASISLPFADPAPAEMLQEVWVTLSGLPKCMRRERRLMRGMRMLGRPLEVDVRSLKARGPVRMQLACRNPEKLKGVVQLFHKSRGYNIGVRVEPEPRVVAPGPPPPPAPGPGSDSDDDDDDILSPSKEEWDEMQRRDRARKEASVQGRGGGSSSAPLPTRQVALDHGATGVGESARALSLDQYGSNLSA